jgi:dCTP deaminase
MANFFEGDGVFPIQWLRRAIDERCIISSATFEDASLQPASLDLRLGETAHRLQCSFLPGDNPVEKRLAELSMGEVDLHKDGGILEQNRPYLVPLLEELRLPDNVHARANPKSSTGRLDVFTRVITDRGTAFDEIGPGYKGKLYLEIVPRSFTVRVKERLSLNQLRLFVGDYRLGPDDIRNAHGHVPLLSRRGSHLTTDELRVSRDGGVFLSLDLTPDKQGFVGHRAKRNSHLVDMSRFDHDPILYWERIGGDHRGLVLEPEAFYLLMSLEAVRVPPTMSAEMTAYDPTSGELRTHYAGFFDPGFGFDPENAFGSRAALEVRAHDVAFLIETGQPVSKLVFEKMAEEPDTSYGSAIGSYYQHQEAALGKHFLGPGSGRQLRLIDSGTDTDEASV